MDLDLDPDPRDLKTCGSRGFGFDSGSAALVGTYPYSRYCKDTDLGISKKFRASSSVADPPHACNFDANPDPDPCHFDANSDQDPACHFDANPDQDPNPACVVDADPDPTFHF
jgi:hypothetical protein